jgi:hypothetical protein
MLTYAAEIVTLAKPREYEVCSRMLTYARVCSRMLAYARVCSRMLTYAAEMVVRESEVQFAFP